MDFVLVFFCCLISVLLSGLLFGLLLLAELLLLLSGLLAAGFLLAGLSLPLVHAFFFTIAFFVLTMSSCSFSATSPLW